MIYEYKKRISTKIKTNGVWITIYGPYEGKKNRHIFFYMSLPTCVWWRISVSPAGGGEAEQGGTVPT